MSIRPPQGYGEPIHRLPEQGTNPVVMADGGTVYTKDYSGITELCYEDSGAKVTQLTDDGAVAGATSPGGSADGVQINDGAGGFGSRLSINSADQLLSDDGTEALPGVSFSSEPDCGMRKAGTDQLAFSTRGSEVGMFVDSGSAIPRMVVKGCLDLGPTMGGGNSGVYGDEATHLFLSVTNGSNFHETEGLRVERKQFRLYPGVASSEGWIRRVMNVVTTTTASVTQFMYWPLTDNHVNLFSAMIIGRDTAGTHRCAYKIDTLAYREGGGGATLGTPAKLYSSETDAGLNADWSASGNNILLMVTGLAGVTINWGVTFDYMNVT